jgi:hypothetical protein
MFKRSSRVLLVTLLLFVLAGATYAFAASNTVPVSYAGDGQNTILGYEVTDVTYTLGSNPLLIEGVSFTLDHAATNVQISLNGADFVTCSNPTGNNWTCSANVTVLSASSLRVVAVE